MLHSSRLLRPLLFLSIRSAGIHRFCWWYPLLWLGGVIAYLSFLPDTIEKKIAIAGSLVTSCSSILMILPGFYIAALAAIATFQAPTMDTALDGRAATLKSSEHGIDRERKLTRRRFLCLLFGYLSFLSLILALLGSLPDSVHPLLFFPEEMEREWGHLCRGVCLGLFGLFFMQLVSLTLLGLFYLSDRIHWRKETYTL